MAERNGYLIIEEMDINPNSPTYNQTRQREVYDTDSCPLPNADYQLVEEYCETNSDTGAQTGWKILVYQDMNPNSPTYLESYNDRVQDETTCPAETIDADWVEISRSCEIITYGSGKTGNNGNVIITYQDMNDVSPTFQDTKDEILYDTVECPAPDVTPNWVEQSRSCNIVNKNGIVGFDGSVTVVEKDTNIYSSTYDTVRERILIDVVKCPPINVRPNWVEQSRRCNKVDGNNNGKATVVEKDTNIYSSTLGQTRERIIDDLVNCPIP